MPQIEVSFAIDSDGVVNVSAKDLGTGRSQSIVITASSGLSEEEVEELVAEAEANKDADRERREWIELKNKAEGLTYSTEKTLEEFADHIEDEDRQAVSDCMEKAKHALAAEDAIVLRACIDELSGVTYQMTERLYAALGDSAESIDEE